MTQHYSKQETDAYLEHSSDTPISVKLLSALLAIGGAILLITQAALFSRFSELSSLLGVSGWVVQGAVAFLGGLGVAAGIGLWLGRQWGWWIALFYFAYAVCRNINAMISIPGLYEAYGSEGDVSMMASYIKYGFRTLWDVLLLYWLCRDTAAYHCGTQHVKKGKALLIVFGASLIIFVLAALLG
ncbi:hypothetical protein [Paenibacillus jiagnxiensis]|uniref:hypothetical protein n=1 Tax=Paenibacillus jiagnxiensis TaxID=3228926 RepID=UPI0033BAC29D